MSHEAAVTVAGNASASRAENVASPAPNAPTVKARSCVVCRHRKVRCDKQSPCGNCRRANIPCVLPATDRPPRWARRVEKLAHSAAASHTNDPHVEKIMGRLRSLEGTVKELNLQLEQARASSVSSRGGGSSGVPSPSTISTRDDDGNHQSGLPQHTSISTVHKSFGRMVIQDSTHSRYVSSGFWSRIDDELTDLKIEAAGIAGADSDTSDSETAPAEAPSSQQQQAAPSPGHYAFLFGQNPGSAKRDLSELHPLPSQMPFLLETFSENVNFIIRVVHLPTVTKMFRDARSGGMARLTPSNEALMFSIYYAAVASMDDDEVLTNFALSKSELSSKYQLGLECALAKADFLNSPNLVIMQAFSIFLLLARRHGSPRFVWMLTGLALRMGQYLGLQRDGSHLKHITPYELEMRRRVWWVLCQLDVKTAEDQGTDFTIAVGSFDTHMPLNINDVDIDPASSDIPTERHGVTDTTFARLVAMIVDISRRMLVTSTAQDVADLDQQSQLLGSIHQKFEEGFLQYVIDKNNDVLYFSADACARIVMSKLMLIAFLPILFSSPSENTSAEIRTKLLIAAIELAEYNHAINAEEGCRQWRWVYQTHTHWYAIVYLMIEITRRPWAAIVERAWVALHSRWLIPAQAYTDKSRRIWVPLRRLMHTVDRHRTQELSRLRAGPQEAIKLELDAHAIPLPSSSALFPDESRPGPEASRDAFDQRWRQLVGLGPSSNLDSPGLVHQGLHPTLSTDGSAGFSTSLPFEASNPLLNGQWIGRVTSSNAGEDRTSKTAMDISSYQMPTGGNDQISHPGWIGVGWPSQDAMGSGFVPWSWDSTDKGYEAFPPMEMEPLDVDMSIIEDMNWYDWAESAKSLE